MQQYITENVYKSTSMNKTQNASNSLSLKECFLTGILGKARMDYTQGIVVQYQYQGGGIGIVVQKMVIPNSRPIPNLCKKSFKEKQRNNRKYLLPRT